jgi:tRNA-specific 2-thiouridylase
VRSIRRATKAISCSGDLPKLQVRAIAQQMGLVVAAKPDSQDICFVPDGDYAAVVRKVRPDADAGGQIVHIDGRVMGEHRGLIHFTIGQRKGLEIGGQPEPLYVVKIDAASRKVIVGPRAALATRAAAITDMNWIGGTFEGPLEVKVRSLAKPAPARIEGSGNARRLVFVQPEYGVAPGQAAVLYAGSRVLGGGWIASTEPVEPALAA